MRLRKLVLYLIIFFLLVKESFYLFGKSVKRRNRQSREFLEGKRPHCSRKSDDKEIPCGPCDVLVSEKKLKRHLKSFLDRVNTDNADNKLNYLRVPFALCFESNEFKINEILSDLKHQSKAVVCIIHDIISALKISDKIIVMKNGTVVKEGTPKQIIESDIINEVFGVEICSVGNEYFYKQKGIL